MGDIDFERYPELTNAQLSEYYWLSPHTQVWEDFRAEVVRVHDGDTITLRWKERDFDFPLRFAEINSPELSERQGVEAGDWLRGLIEGTMVDIIIDKGNRVDKFGRLIGTVVSNGLPLNQVEVMQGRATPFWQQDEGEIPAIPDVLMKDFPLPGFL
jgi:endonuclease YncB( thermonuclease family)